MSHYIALLCLGLFMAPQIGLAEQWVCDPFEFQNGSRGSAFLLLGDEKSYTYTTYIGAIKITTSLKLAQKGTLYSLYSNGSDVEPEAYFLERSGSQLNINTYYMHYGPKTASCQLSR